MQLRRPVSFALAVGLVLAACGGDDESTDTVDTVPATEASEPTDPPATDPPATEAPEPTDPPATDPPATDPPATDPASGVPAGLEAYCAASADFYVSADALDYVVAGDSAAIGTLLTDLQDLAAAVIAVAPDAQAAEPPQRALDALDGLVGGLSTVEFDLDRIDEVPDSDALGASFQQFDDVYVELEGFLTDTCGEDLGELTERAAARYAEIASGVAAGSSIVSDDSGTIEVRVPAAWSSVDGAPVDGAPQLAAAADLDALNDTFSEPGVIIVSVDATGADGAEVWPAMLDGATGEFEALGCQLIEGREYTDALYTGELREYRCDGAPGHETVVVGGTDGLGSVAFVVAMVLEAGDLDTRRMVLDSFYVG